MFGVIGLLVFLWVCWLLIKRFGLVKFIMGSFVFAASCGILSLIIHVIYEW